MFRLNVKQALFHVMSSVLAHQILRHEQQTLAVAVRWLASRTPDMCATLETSCVLCVSLKPSVSAAQAQVALMTLIGVADDTIYEIWPELKFKHLKKKMNSHCQKEQQC